MNYLIVLKFLCLIVCVSIVRFFHYLTYSRHYTSVLWLWPWATILAMSWSGVVADTVTSHKHLLHLINHGQKWFHPNQFQFVFEVDFFVVVYSRSFRLCNKIGKSFFLFWNNCYMIISLNTYVTKKPDWIKNVIMSMIELTNISLKLMMHWWKKD